MAQLLHPPPRHCFLSELDTLTIERTAVTESSCLFELRTGGDTLLSASLVFDKKRQVVVSDLARTLRPFCGAEEESFRNVYVSINGTPHQFQPLPNNLHLATPFGNIAPRRFLTLCPGTRPTLPTATERLSVWSTDGETAPLVAHLLWAEGKEVRETTEDIVPSTFVEGGTFRTMEWHNRQFSPPSPLARLLGYTVEWHGRRHTFEIVNTYDATPVTATFRNSFGLLDTFHFLSHRTTETKQTRATARYLDGLRLVDLDTTEEHTLHTLPLTPDTEPLLRDLLSSREVYIDGEAVIVTETEYKPTNSPYNLPTAAITYIYPHGTPLDLDNTRGIFDDTFDPSFE